MNSIQRKTSKASWHLKAVACCCLLLTFAACSARRSEQSRADGDTYLRLGKIEEARAAYSLAAKANPDNAMAQLGLARCAVAEEDVDNAVDFFNRASTLDTELEPAYVEAIRVLLEHDRADEAREVASKWEQVNP